MTRIIRPPQTTGAMNSTNAPQKTAHQEGDKNAFRDELLKMVEEFESISQKIDEADSVAHNAQKNANALTADVSYAAQMIQSLNKTYEGMNTNTEKAGHSPESSGATEPVTTDADAARTIAAYQKNTRPTPDET